jgi:hypothetical protein
MRFRTEVERTPITVSCVTPGNIVHGTDISEKCETSSVLKVDATLFRNVGTYMLNYTASYYRTL